MELPAGPGPTIAARANVDPDQVCGTGLAFASGQDQIELDGAHEAEAASIRQQISFGLANSPEERKRAIGLRMLRRVDETEGAAARHTDALAKMASTSNDPFIYALAMDACRPFARSLADAPSCGLISSPQWARIDSNNVIPWLHVAAQATARADAAAADEALYRASVATTSRLYGNEIVRVVIDELPAGASAFLRAQVVEPAVVEAATWALPEYQTVTRYCAERTLVDSNRWQTCTAIAEGFVSHPSSLLEFGLGVRLAERMAWPVEKVSSLREEYESFHAVTRSGGSTEAPPWSCRAYDEIGRRWREIADKGEVGAARDRLAASGLTRAELAAPGLAERAARRARMEAAPASAPVEEASSRYSSAPPPAR